ncbi:MAG: hypothetical protein JNJ70_00400 [Verrucomicrobiales bacterium]|nr:hypothetical protein [Verrucomicrobiales bacterium]
MKSAAFATSALAVMVLISGFLPEFAFANGGGYETGGVKATGDAVRFEPRLTKGVRIVDEQLHIGLGPSSASVRVRYRMANVSPSRLKVRFGFPVEEVKGGEHAWAELAPAVVDDKGKGGKGLLGLLGGAKPISKPQPDTEAELPTPPKALAYCRDYRVSADGSSVAASFEPEDRGKEDTRFANLTGWLVSELEFQKGEEKEVEIAFESLYARSVTFVSDNSNIKPVRFVYRLSTAACWAGPIGKGRVVLEPRGIDPEEVRVIKPANRFRKEGDLWVWEFEELMPTLDDDIEIEAQPAIDGNADEMEGSHLSYFNQRGERWEMSHSNYRIKASSEQALDSQNGSAEKLKTWGSWISKEAGPGDWLELKPAVPKPLAAISFDFNGHYSEKGSFQAYARPKRISVTLNGEHRFTMDVPDAPDPPGIAENYRHVVNGYNTPVSTIRLEIEDVWPGKVHPQLSLKNLQLHVLLDKKPVLKPNR